MTTPFVSHPVTRVRLVDGSMDGLRQVDSFGSMIGVRAAPLSDLDRLKSFSHSGYLAYVIDAVRLYTGHGQSDRKIGDRMGNLAGLRDSCVYLIYSLDERFNKLTAAYVEARLIDIAHELAIPLANGTRPFGPFPILSDDLEQLVQHAQILLQVAGFQRFEKARRSPPQRGGASRPRPISMTFTSSSPIRPISRRTRYAWSSSGAICGHGATRSASAFWFWRVRTSRR